MKFHNKSTYNTAKQEVINNGLIFEIEFEKNRN